MPTLHRGLLCGLKRGDGPALTRAVAADPGSEHGPLVREVDGTWAQNVGGVRTVRVRTGLVRASVTEIVSTGLGDGFSPQEAYFHPLVRRALAVAVPEGSSVAARVRLYVGAVRAELEQLVLSALAERQDTVGAQVSADIAAIELCPEVDDEDPFVDLCDPAHANCVASMMLVSQSLAQLLAGATEPPVPVLTFMVDDVGDDLFVACHQTDQGVVPPTALETPELDAAVRTLLAVKLEERALQSQRCQMTATVLPMASMLATHFEQVAAADAGPTMAASGSVFAAAGPAWREVAEVGDVRAADIDELLAVGVPQEHLRDVLGDPATEGPAWVRVRGGKARVGHFEYPLDRADGWHAVTPKELADAVVSGPYDIMPAVAALSVAGAWGTVKAWGEAFYEYMSPTTAPEPLDADTAAALAVMQGESPSAVGLDESKWSSATAEAVALLNEEYPAAENSTVDAEGVLSWRTGDKWTQALARIKARSPSKLTLAILTIIVVGVAAVFVVDASLVYAAAAAIKTAAVAVLGWGKAIVASTLPFLAKFGLSHPLLAAGTAATVGGVVWAQANGITPSEIAAKVQDYWTSTKQAIIVAGMLGVAFAGVRWYFFTRDTLPTAKEMKE